MNDGRLKRFAFGTLSFLGILRLAEISFRGVPILAYHGVTANDGRDFRNRRRLHVSVVQFRRQVQRLSTRWRPIALSEYLAGAQAGRPSSRRTVVLTFDDGYRNFLTTAWPVLRDHRVPAALFVPTHEHGRFWSDQLEAALASTRATTIRWEGQDYPLSTPAEREASAALLIRRLQPLDFAGGRTRALRDILAMLGEPRTPPDDDRDRLNWDELRHLRAEGVEIGSHSDRHEDLRFRPPTKARIALAESLERLRDELGPGEYAISYPYGGYDAPTAVAAREIGFSGGLTTDPGLNTRAPDMFALRRCLIGADDDLARLNATLSGLRAAIGRRLAP